MVPQKIGCVGDGSAFFLNHCRGMSQTSSFLGLAGGIGNSTTIVRCLLDSGGEGGSPGHALHGPTGMCVFLGGGGGIVVARAFVVRVFV